MCAPAVCASVCVSMQDLCTKLLWFLCMIDVDCYVI